jgi:hypothetical protein
MNPYILVLAILAVIFLIFNIYQFLVMRAALRIAEILYVMSRNVRQKASEVRRSKKDVEIIEAHLFDIATSARTLLKTLGRNEKSIDPDPSLSVTTNGHSMDSNSLVRLADNIFFAIKEENPDMGWDESVDLALNRFLEKVPTMERQPARKIVMVVAQEHRAKELEQMMHKEDFEEALFTKAKEEK